MKIKFAVLITISVLLCNAGFSQEYLTGFSFENHIHENTTTTRNKQSLTLPFFDDFSDTKVFPNQKKWQNRNVFVNDGFPLFPTNYQAATFDVLDKKGSVYSNGSSNAFIADSLISMPIRLEDENGERLSPADSVYLSFYFQPQGNGDAPESHDSLVLRFGYVIDTFRIEYDSVMVGEMLNYMQVDTINIGDILYHNYTSSCDLDMYTLAERQYTSADSMVWVNIPCDTVFYSETIWNHVWSTPGMSLDSLLLTNNNHYFKQVMIPIVNEKYFENDLIILFYNYGSLPTTMYPNDRSNGDIWNVDFIYLNKDRNYKDTSYPMVTFSQRSPSLLKRYQSMPYRQYKNNPTAAIATDYEMFIANLDSVSSRIQYKCHIEKITSEWHFDYTSKWCNLSPFNNGGFQNCNGDNATQACPHLTNFLFDMDPSSDSATYLITHIITTDNETSAVQGDTLYGTQGFYNYYSYDDGTPEKGYGVVPDDSYFASQFSISMMDTLSGVQLLFNKTYNDANYDFFDIVVWNDNNGKPGNEIYRIKNQRPKWDEEHIYKFGYYPFDKIVKVNGIIYVGIMQHSQESINIGFDTSIDNSQYNFYDSGDGWQNSMMHGSLMIRPIVGGKYYIGTEEILAENNVITIYPNPANDYISIAGLDINNCDDISIFDVTGRMIKHCNNETNINTCNLNNGLYLLRIITKDGKYYNEKFMISR